MLPLSLNMIRAAPEAWYCSRRKALSRSAEPAHFPSFSDFYQSHTWLYTWTTFFHRRCCRWSSCSFSLSTLCIAGIQLWETIMVRHGLMLVGQTVSGKTEVENALGLVERSLLGISSCLDGCGKRSHNWRVLDEVLAAALAAVADGENYLPVQCLECYHMKHVLEISSLSDHVFSIQGADSQDQSEAWDLATLRSCGVKLILCCWCTDFRSDISLRRSIKQGQLYGENDEGTQEWTAGHLRACANDYASQCNDAKSNASANLVWHLQHGRLHCIAGWNPCPHGPLCIVSWAEQTAMDSAGWTRWCSTPLRKYISCCMDTEYANWHWTHNGENSTNRESALTPLNLCESDVTVWLPFVPWHVIHSHPVCWEVLRSVEKCWTTCSARCMPLALACFVGPVDAWHEYLDHEGQQASVFEFEHLSFFVLA